MKKLIIVSLLTAVFICGCSSNNNDLAVKENEELKKQLAQIKKQNEELEKSIKEKDVLISSLNKQILENKEKENAQPVVKQEEETKIGQDIKYKGITFKVDGTYVTNACKVKLYEDQYVNYSATNKFLLVQVSAVNSSNIKIKLDNFKYKLIEKGGNQYDVTLKTGELIKHDNMETELMGGKNLRIEADPKVKKTGMLMFDVPNPDGEYELKVYYKNDDNLEIDYNGANIVLKK
ncbi:DUF4352 domain-containing protein [Clostridiaceae bacterium M8S5]|nr:DUF4352 domain-containing protein [Clostridiaceae bacterium M8S5]